MTDFLDEYAVRFRAAAEAEEARRRVPLPPVAALVAGVTLLIVLAGGQDPEIERRPAPATSGFAEQRALLGVLGRRQERDSHPQVRATLREYAELGPRAGRLLGFAPSGGAFVLLATRRYVSSVGRRPDGLCLVRRGSEGGAGICAGTSELRAGRLQGALAGQAYGVVPDGVASVRPAGRDEPVPVRRNFYVYPVRGSAGSPVWLDAEGKEIPPQDPPLPFLNRRGSASLDDYRGQVVVLGFWASWCRPCRPQLRELQDLQERVDGGVAVLGAATKDLARNARAALARDGVKVPVFHDPEGQLTGPYGVKAFPETLVLAPDGSVVKHLRGIARAADIERWVEVARRR